VSGTPEIWAGSDGSGEDGWIELGQLGVVWWFGLVLLGHVECSGARREGLVYFRICVCVLCP